MEFEIRRETDGKCYKQVEEMLQSASLVAHGIAGSPHNVKHHAEDGIYKAAEASRKVVKYMSKAIRNGPPPKNIYLTRCSIICTYSLSHWNQPHGGVCSRPLLPPRTHYHINLAKLSLGRLALAAALVTALVALALGLGEAVVGVSSLDNEY